MWFTEILDGLIPEAVVNKCYNYLLHRYLGRFIAQKLDSSQLKIDICNGTCSMEDIRLDVEELNEMANKQNWPMEFVDGSIGQIFLKIPYRSIMKESSIIEISSLKITMQPKQRFESATSMFDTMWTSMTSSTHMAEECIRKDRRPSQDEQSYEGITVFAEIIESIMSRVKVYFKNTVFQLEHLPRESTMGVGLIINIDLIAYKDESSSDSEKEEDTEPPREDDKKHYSENSYTIRSTRLEGITLSTVEFTSDARTVSQSMMTASSVDENEDSLTSILENTTLDEKESASRENRLDQYSTCSNRHVIPFGKFQGKSDVIMRLKSTEEIEGPKVSIFMDMSHLLMFLTPRQIYLLIELASGLSSPDNEDHSNMGAKPMSSADFAQIGKDLQQKLNAPNFRLSGLVRGQGWATGASEEDVDENFMPMKKQSSTGMFESALSLDTTMGSSYTSSIASSCTECSNRTRKRSSRSDTDPSAEISRFEVHMSSLSLVLLHEDLLTESLGDLGTLVPSTVRQMQTTVRNFFTTASPIFTAKDFKSFNSILDQACQASHLRLLASSFHLEGDEKTTSAAFSISGYLETEKLELKECLCEENSVKHIDLLSFKPVHIETPITAKPSLKLIFKHIEKTTKGSRSGPKTELTFSLDKCNIELDVTIIDRITALLHPQKICNVNKSTNPWLPSAGEAAPSDVDSKIDVKVISPSAVVKLRFPKPDFRPPHDMNRVPWWKQNIRKDYLSLAFLNFAFETSLQSNQTVQNYLIHSRGISVFYNEDDNAVPIPIAKAGCDDKTFSSMQDLLTDCKLDIKIFPRKIPTVEDMPTGPELMAMSLGGQLIEGQHQDNGPFSSKKIFYESDTPHHKYQNVVDSKVLKTPGEKSEINDFIKRTIASARIHFDISLPTVSVQLLSKHLYELIYNRVNNDLLLWEPSAPKPKSSNLPTYENLKYRRLDLEAGQEVFSLCKSGIHYDSESESEDEEESTNIYYSTYEAKMKLSNRIETKGESYVVVNLQISRGLLSMCAPVRDVTTNNVIPGQQGEFFINLENANVFLVNGYMGDPNVSYICLELSNGQLFHCDMSSTPSQSPPIRDIGVVPGQNLQPTVYKSETGMDTGTRNKGCGREMVTLCVKIQASHETHHVKNIAIAGGFNKVTLRHRMCKEPNSWMMHLMDFFNVKDYPIPGYQAKDIITELYVHFWDSAIDYRPRHLPLRSVLTLGSFSISSHLSADVNTSTLRFIAEECGLFISRKGINKNRLPYSGPVDLRRDYVNVIDLGLFDISLKTTDKKNSEIPHIDLRASNNMIHIRTCADSAIALTQLINYIANDGDLLGREENASSAFSSPRHVPEQKLVNVEPQEIVNVTTSQHQKIHDLLQDALKEEDKPTEQQTQRSSEFYSYNGAKLFYFPDENQPLSADSGQRLPQVTSELGQVPFQANLADADDDFCFIDEEPGYDIFPKSGTPEIKWLTDEPVRLVENHFNVPTERIDPLKTPDSFPTPTMRYALCEMSIIWHMYGGEDFEKTDDKSKKKNVNFSDTKLQDKVTYRVNENVSIKSERTRPKILSWVCKGGPNRDHAVLMELQLNKIKFQHEVYPDSSSKASRQVLIITEFEVRDRLKCSQMNKFLYQYTSQSRPKRSNANMLTIKTVHVRPDPQLNRQECCLKVSLQPLRFNIDQDALLFLIKFFKELGGEVKDDDVLPAVSSKQNTPIHQPPIMTVGESIQRNKEEAKKIIDESLLILLEENKTHAETSEEEDEPASTPLSGSLTEDSPIYFRSVTFAPDVPIRLDYHGKYIDISHGPVHGVLMGLAQLNCSELRLKRISHRYGILGIDKLLAFFINEWLNDIKKNQIPNLLVGVGPITSIVQLFQGFRDLFCLPFEQYKKDGRFFRGLHRGAHSFTTSTFMAAIELTSRVIYAIQVTAETAFDMLTPGPSVKIHPKTKSRRKRYGRPKDIREGVTNAYMLVKEGLEETADNIYQVASHEHEQKGYSGAVGGVIRQLPPTIIKPIIIASEATNNVLGGMRCQLLPDARKEATDKWRSEDDSIL